MSHSFAIQTLPHTYQTKPGALQGRIILVTGAGAGIGRAAALSYAAHGATVILLGRTLAKLEAVYDAIEQAGGPQPAIYPIDFAGAKAQDYVQMCNTLEKEFGHLDGLLHNASDLGDRTPISLYTPSTWERLMQVNVTAPFMLTQALLALLEKSDGASIVMTSSGVARKGRAFWGAYAVSKAAHENFMQVLADELEGTSRVRCNSINPGATRTAMRALAYPAEDPNTLKTPEDIMPLYVYLMAADSREVNGQQFNAQ